jgi:4-hydroxybenzoate polyprenyltransferase
MRISVRLETDHADGGELGLPMPLDHPLYVDLDGTLYPGDTLWDSIILAIARSPTCALRLPLMTLRGPLHVKTWLASQARPDATLLPYRTKLVALCRLERERGRRVVLATGAHRSIAEAVAEHLGCFDAVIATDTVNRKGSAKLAAIREDTAEGAFFYAGDSEPDRGIWSSSQGALAAGRAARWGKPQVGADVLARFPDSYGRLTAVVQAVRPHQWVKNILVFVPLLASHRLSDARAVAASLIMFVAFCGCASSVYLLNDLVDLENDRAHHCKQRRPLAAGMLPVSWALPLIPGLLAAAAALASWTSPNALGVLAVYYAMTLAYSVSLKQKLLVDVFTLASLYTIRCLAGHAATGIPYSPWLLGFMIFLFLSLAFAKRHSELHHLRAAGGRLIKGRGYEADDLELVSMFGVAAGFAAALVMGLYVTSNAVTQLYNAPMLLWALCPIVLFWVSRVWLIAHRGDLNDDPVLWTLKDRTSYVLGAVAAVLIAAATLLPTRGAT